MNSTISPISQHGELFSQAAILNKGALNREFQQGQPSGKVAILWYMSSKISHAAIVVDDKPFGFKEEAASLKNLIERAKTGRHIRWSSIGIQEVKVNFFQYRKIKELISKPHKLLPVGTCMHAVFKILDLAKVPIEAPPFPVNQLPDVSRLYLQQKYQKNGSKLLGKIKYYGQCKDLKDEDNWRYIKNILLIPSLAGACLTVLSMQCIADFTGQSLYSFPVIIGAATLSVAYTAYSTLKAFSKI